MLLSHKIRIEVSEQDAATLEFMQAKCRGLYNWWVMRLRDGEHWPGAYAAKKTLQASKAYDPELRYVYGKLLHEVYFRIDKAMKAFYRRCKERKEGEKSGFPRFKPRHAFFTLCYPAMYIKVEGNIVILPTGGKGAKNKHFPTIMARLTEIPPPAYREVAISRDAHGHYHASFVYEQAEHVTRDQGVVAFDLGVKVRREVA